MGLCIFKIMGKKEKICNHLQCTILKSFNNMGSGTVACKKNLSNKHKYWLSPIHTDVSWNFTTGLNEKTMLSSKKSHTLPLILEVEQK